MGLNLRIENLPRMPDGGPLSYVLTGARGADIGRDAHLDWTLPDPGRHVSGKHCEIRFNNGSYFLYDVSRNGTFLNGSEHRLQSPHRLRTGDRLLIGHYIIGVEVEEEVAARPHEVAALPDMGDPWGGAENPAPPLDPRDLRPAAQMVPVRPDFLEWAVDVPNGPGERLRGPSGRVADAGYRSRAGTTELGCGTHASTAATRTLIAHSDATSLALGRHRARGAVEQRPRTRGTGANRTSWPTSDRPPASAAAREPSVAGKRGCGHPFRTRGGPARRGDRQTGRRRFG